MLVTAAAFAFNEAARFTLRAPLFKTVGVGGLFWLTAPTLYFLHYQGDAQANERVNNLWQIHKNRMDRNLGGTHKEGNIGDGHYNLLEQHGYHGTREFTMLELLMGDDNVSFLDNAFVRWHKDIHEYPDHHSDYDDLHMTVSDEFERRKPFKSKSKVIKGETNLVTHKDDDEKPPISSVTGEHPFTHPMGSSKPVIDHGCDEEEIWSFPRNLYNQELVPN